MFILSFNSSGKVWLDMFMNTFFYVGFLFLMTNQDFKSSDVDFCNNFAHQTVLSRSQTCCFVNNLINWMKKKFFSLSFSSFGLSTLIFWYFFLFCFVFLFVEWWFARTVEKIWTIYTKRSQLLNIKTKFLITFCIKISTSRTKKFDVKVKKAYCSIKI